MLKVEITIQNPTVDLKYVSCTLLAEDRGYNSAIEYDAIDNNKMIQGLEIALNKMLTWHEEYLLTKKEK